MAIESQALAREVGAFLDEHLERARRIDARGRPEGAEGRYPGVSPSKVCRLRLPRLLAPFIRSQL